MIIKNYEKFQIYIIEIFIKWSKSTVKCDFNFFNGYSKKKMLKACFFLLNKINLKNELTI